MNFRVENLWRTPGFARGIHHPQTATETAALLLWIVLSTTQLNIASAVVSNKRDDMTVDGVPRKMRFSVLINHEYLSIKISKFFESSAAAEAAATRWDRDFVRLDLRSRETNHPKRRQHQE